jgi:hypothetical protein
MDDLKSARADSATARSAETKPRPGPLCCSRRRWLLHRPELKFWSASFRVTAICALLVSVVSDTPAMARGGHGMGGFGIHEGHGMGGGEGLLTPTYVLITVSKITDAEVSKGALRDLIRLSAAAWRWTRTNRYIGKEPRQSTS